MCVVDAHTAEDGERFDKVLVILGKGVFIEFIDQLYNSNNLTRRVLDGHAEDRAMPKPSALVDRWIELGVLVGIGDVYRLQNYNKKK